MVSSEPAFELIFISFTTYYSFQIMDFDRLIASGEDSKLRCSFCQKYLSHFPVALCSNNQNICKRCKLPKGLLSYQNEAYQTVCQYLKFPCTYKPQGCIELLLPADVPTHEGTCPFRVIKCFLKDCNWKGCLPSLIPHYENIHFEKFLVKNEFTINMKSTMSDYRSFLMKYHGKILVFMWRFDTGTKKLEFSIHYNQYHHSTDTHVCQLRIGTEHTTMVHEFRSTSFQRMHLIELDLSSFESACIDGNVVCRFIIKDDYDDRFLSDGKQDTFLEFLKCSNCLKYVQPPVIRSGKTLKVHCPTCRSSIPQKEAAESPKVFRDFCLDTIAFIVSYPCQYTSNHCSFKGPIVELKIHEKACPYQTTKCPILAHHVSCVWKGAKKDLYNHIMADHHQLIHDMDDVLKLSPKNSEGEFKIIKFCERLFRLAYCVGTDKIYKWSVQTVLNDGQVFKFEIDVIDTTNKGQILAMSRVCSPAVPEEEIFTNPKTYCFAYADQVESLAELEEKDPLVSFKVKMFL